MASVKSLREWVATLDSYANETYGRSIWSAVLAGICVCCGDPVHPFDSERAETVFAKVGLCGRCQQVLCPDDVAAAAAQALIEARRK
jgi:hypothetical protein